MSSRLFCESICEVVFKPSPNGQMGSLNPHMHLEPVVNDSPKSITCNTFFVRQKLSQNNRQVIACVVNPSPTLLRGSHTHRNLVSVICTMRQICDTNAKGCDIISLIWKVQFLKSVRLRYSFFCHVKVYNTSEKS